MASLNALEPDCILIEGPPEANEFLSFIVHEQMVPPVALLVHASEDASRAVFYPFAEFSPEWQALRWAIGRSVHARFMDLPVGISLAISAQNEAAGSPEALSKNPGSSASSSDAEQIQLSLLGSSAMVRLGTTEGTVPEASEDENPTDNLDAACADPLTHLARAAGYEDGEAWWNHLVEERGDGKDLFEAIAEAMRALREHEQAVPSQDGEGDETLTPNLRERREALREAHMRQTMRQAVKDGFQRIAVVCGAWHVPSLENLSGPKEDTALLKGLPRTKTSVTWVPWTHANLSRASGYGAGINSPGWYEFIWRHDPAKSSRAIGWLAHVAHLLRERDIDCSSAHVIEAARLAQTLAVLRERHLPGLAEINEAIFTVICNGNPAPMALIKADLTIGNRLGHVPDSVPSVPLQKDIEQTQSRLRMKPQAFSKTLELDLRNDNDLERSQFLHRLNLLDIRWGMLKKVGNSRGTFKEIWDIQWKPELAVSIIEASHWGVMLQAASTAKVIADASKTEDLTDIAKAVDAILLANLHDAVGPVSKLLEERAALTGDVGQLLGTIQPLSNVHRYGSVRKFDTAVVARVLDGVIVRAGIGLPGACSGIDSNEADGLREQLIVAHEAIALRNDTALSHDWSRSVSTVARMETAHALLRGSACRLMLDEKTIESDEVERHLSLSLSPASDPLSASEWLDGFLNRNATVLLHDSGVWNLVDRWLESLPEEQFVSVLPLVRRTFSSFSGADRKDLGQRAARGQVKAEPLKTTTSWDPQRATRVLPVLCQIFGIAA